MTIPQRHRHRLKGHLEKLTKIKRKKHHPLLHHIHKTYGLSKKTLLYVKEYGPHSHIAKVIFKESMNVLLFASLISSIGGLGLEYIKTLFISLTPMIILLPTMNDMIGDYSIIISSRFSTMLHEGFGLKKWSAAVNDMFWQVMILSLITAAISGGVALLLSKFSGFVVTKTVITKIIMICLIDTVILVAILFTVAIIAGLHYYRKQEDPNNFLIPISTAIADFGNTFIMCFLVLLFF